MDKITTNEFIENTLKELSDIYNIPEEMVSHLVALLIQFPDTSILGAKKELKDGLEQQIENLRQQGMFK